MEYVGGAVFIVFSLLCLWSMIGSIKAKEGAEEIIQGIVCTIGFIILAFVCMKKW